MTVFAVEFAENPEVHCLEGGAAGQASRRLLLTSCPVGIAMRS